MYGRYNRGAITKSSAKIRHFGTQFSHCFPVLSNNAQYFPLLPTSASRKKYKTSCHMSVCMWRRAWLVRANHHQLISMQKASLIYFTAAGGKALALGCTPSFRKCFCRDCNQLYNVRRLTPAHDASCVCVIAWYFGIIAYIIKRRLSIA